MFNTNGTINNSGTFENTRWGLINVAQFGNFNGNFNNLDGGHLINQGVMTNVGVLVNKCPLINGSFDWDLRH